MKNEDLEHLIDNFPGYMAISDVEGHILAINKNLARVFQKPRNELIGQSGFMLVDDQAGGRRKQCMQEAVHTKKISHLVDQDKGRWWNTSFVPILDASNKVTKLCFYIEDITEEKEQELKNLERKENYYKSLIENSTDLIALISPDMKFFYQSPSLERILGYQPKARKNRSIMDNVHPDEIKNLKTVFDKILSQPGYQGFIKLRVRHIDGDYRFLEGTVNNQIDNPQIQGIIVNARDVTEKELLQKKYENLVKNINDGVFLLDLDGKITFINSAIEKRSGIPYRDLTKLYFLDLVKKEYHSIAKKRIEELKSGKEVEPFTVEYETPDGSSFFVETHMKAVYEDGQLIGFQGISRDVTDREQRERETKKRKQYLESLMDSTSEIIFTIDKTHTIGIWNKAAENLTGYSRNEVQNKKINNLNIFADSNELETYVDSRIQAKTNLSSQIVINTKNEMKRLLHVSTSVIRQGDNHDEVIFVCNDITFRDEAHGMLIAGTSYLITDTSIQSTSNLFQSLIKQGWKGYYISREDEQFGEYSIEKSTKKATISAYSSADDVIRNPENLLKGITDFLNTHSPGVILLDRIDYLISLYGFLDVLKILYQLNDIIKQKQAVLLLRVNKLLFTPEQYAYLIEEFHRLPSRETTNIYLNDELYSVLHFIDVENSRNIHVNQKLITIKLGISKVTAQKRIQELYDKQLIVIKKKGKSKYMYTTDKARELLSKRNVL